MTDQSSTHEPVYDGAVSVAHGVVRVTARNPSPYTRFGTNTYLVGAQSLAVIDPGPLDEKHLDLLLSSIGDRPVTYVLVTHTHRDHSPLAPRLAQATGARTVGEGPHRFTRAVPDEMRQRLEASCDLDFTPDIALADDEVLHGEGWALRAVHTPGHAVNHVAYALEGSGALFSGDHVMGWSTTIVSPPDGSMADYMASLDKLLRRDDRLYLPGHGDAIEQPEAYVRHLRAHRKLRERAILARLKAGDRAIPEIVAALYRSTPPALHGAAGLTVLAHLEDLTMRGKVRMEGEFGLEALFVPA